MAEQPRRAATEGRTFHLQKAGRLEQWRSRRQIERRQREIADAVRQRPFPIYGLPSSWESDRALSGSSGGRKTGLNGVRLAHVIGATRRPVTVYVSTWRQGAGGVAERKEEVEFDLGLRNDDDDPIGELEWMRMRIPVDGVPTDFEVIAGRGDQWGAVGASNDVVISVEVSNFAMADVVLEKVTDVEPYLAGRERPK